MEYLPTRNISLIVIPSTFDGQAGEYDDTPIHLDARNFDIESMKNNRITIYDGDDDYFGSIVFRLDGNKLEMVIYVDHIQLDKTITISNDTTASEITEQIVEYIAEHLNV